MKILIMGLPGAGKTTLAAALQKDLTSRGMNVSWYNADDIRRQYNDWDFSHEGRIRQSLRMRDLADNDDVDCVICDFIAPLPEMRDNFKADWVVWVDSIEKSKYTDTNALFVPPTYYDFRITEQDAEKWSAFIGRAIEANQRRPVFDPKRETVQMLGRWQPWHAGHRALFERLIQKTGQVAVMVRDCCGWNGNNNPLSFDEVTYRICRDLEPLYQGQYKVIEVPNIVHIGYGRDVGYTIGQEIFDEQIHAISATNIRKTMAI